MKPRSAIVQGALALAGLGAAYVTWQRPPTLAPGDVTVLSVSPHDLQKVHFDSPDRAIELTRGELNGHPVLWVDEDEHPVQHSAAPGAKALTSATWHRTLVGNDVADKVLDQIVALRATRALGKLPADKLKELGLADPKMHLVVDSEGASERFAISVQPSGESSPYLLRERDQQVFLLGGMLIPDLNGASRLLDRRLHAFPPDAFDTVAVKVGDKSRSFVSKSLPGGYLPELRDSADAKPDEKAKAWHDQLWRSFPSEMLGRGETVPGGEPTSQLRVEYRDRGDLIGWLELGKAQDGYYARTEHTASWVKLGGPAEELVRQTQQLVAGQ